MASITIRNLDDQLKQHLRVRAAQHGRSMDDEAREILRLALAEAKASPQDLAASVHRRFAALGGVELPPVPREPGGAAELRSVIVLDTNVLSELMKPEPDPTVAAWISARPATSLFTTTVTQAEILYGLQLLPLAKRRSRPAVGDMFATDFAGRFLPFDQAAAQAYAEIAASRRRAGRPIAPFDAQIAAIARSRDAGVATRNVVDFEGCSIEVIDPWQG